MLSHLWRENDAVLTFEWILLISLLIIAMIAGASSIRDSLVNELSDVATGVTLINQSFSIANPPSVKGQPAQNTASSLLDGRLNDNTFSY